MEKEKRIYIKDYLERDSKKCNDFIEKIKNKHYENLISIEPYKKNYLGFDGDFVIITTIEKTTNRYNPPHTTAKISIEKIGPNTTKKSLIEEILLKEGFKEESKKK